MYKNQELLFTGVKILLTVVFLHRCFVIYDRWSVGRMETHQTSQAFNGQEPFPAFTFRTEFPRNQSTYLRGDQLRSFVSLATHFNGNSRLNEYANNDFMHYFKNVAAAVT